MEGHGGDVLRELVVVFGAAVAVALVLRRLHVPAVVGLLLAGALIGPTGLGLLHDVDRIALLAEIGVVLLLFTIGLELSISELRRLAGTMLRLGVPQVAITVLAVTGVAVLLGTGVRRGIFLGFLVALSSTAIVLRILSERGDTDAPHGRATLAVLLLQDLAVVPMMMVVPLLAGQQAQAGTGGLLAAIVRAVLLLAAALVLARTVIPRVLSVFAGPRRRDLFVLAVLLVCAGVAWGASFAGLSLALGAFLGGVVLADSEYGHQALADVLPLRDTFASVFFISMGMLLDTTVLLAQAGLVAALVVGIVMVKGAVVMAAAFLAGLPLRSAILSGFALAQVGEFSFVLAQQGAQVGLLSAAASRAFLAASVLTMLFTPLALRLAPRLAAWAAGRAGPVREPEEPAEPDPGDHVLILGLGLGGQLLAEALRANEIPYAIVDLDKDRVQRAREKGEPVHYGDAASATILEHVGVARARHVVVVINDPDAARRSVRIARELAPEVPITVRGRYLAEIPELEKAGATDVVAQEVEASVEIIARVLRVASVPRNVIEERVREARGRTGASGRSFTLPRRRLGEVTELTGLKVDSFLVRETAWIAGRCLAGSDLRSRTGATIIAIGRGAETAVHPPPEYVVAAADVLYLVGEGPRLAAARDLLEGGPQGA